MMRGCCTSWVSASWRNASNSDRGYLTAAKEQCAASYHDTAQPNASAADLATITNWQADALFAATPSALPLHSASMLKRVTLSPRMATDDLHVDHRGHWSRGAISAVRRPTSCCEAASPMTTPSTVTSLGVISDRQYSTITPSIERNAPQPHDLT